MIIQVVTMITTSYDLETEESTHRAEITPSDDAFPQILTLAAVIGGCRATIKEVQALAPELVELDD